MTAILIIVGVLLLTFLIVATSHSRIAKIYDKYLKITNSSNVTGEQFAAFCVNQFNLNIKLALTRKKMNDAYDYKNKVLILSEDVCFKPSLSSVAIVAHEIGHALQDKENSKLFGFTNLLSKFTRFTNKLVFPGLLVGIVMFVLSVNPTITYSVLGVAAGLFLLNILTKFITIPLEMDASKRALKILTDHEVLNKTELKRAKKLLNTAAQTYISSFFDGFLPFGKEVTMYMNKKRR